LSLAEEKDLSRDGVEKGLEYRLGLSLRTGWLRTDEVILSDRFLRFEKRLIPLAESLKAAPIMFKILLYLHLEFKVSKI
jgi:hypothetical protein